MTNEERILLEDELLKLEVIEDEPDFMTKEDIKRLKEIRKLLKEEKWKTKYKLDIRNLKSEN